MNISFFLKPKAEVKYLLDGCPLRQALDDMIASGFTAVPVIDSKGRYIGTICEGDFLRLLCQKSMDEVAELPVGRVERRFRHRTVSIGATMEGLVELVTDQNFVPVVDGRGMFSGIITRRDVIQYMNNTAQKKG